MQYYITFTNLEFQIKSPK